MKTFIKLSYALLLTLGLYSNSFGQASIYPYFAISVFIIALLESTCLPGYRKQIA